MLRMMKANDFIPTSAEVHLWAIWLTAPDKVSLAYRSLLSPEETARADKFAFEHLKRRHELSHGGLRLLLARYLRCRPRDLAFTFGPKGKPALRDSHFQFNLSNSGELVVYAFAVDCELGVDVELVRPMTDLKQIASRYFCQAEASELLSIHAGQARQEAFYRCWTRKEAYIKAIGSGLTLPLDQFQVTLLPDDTPRFVHIGENAKAANEWTLQNLNPAPAYIGALAYHGAARKIVFHQVQAPQKLLEQVG
jgi:4'-phosphopantetheinyl transferase